MEAFGAGGAGGDGTRDLFPNPDPHSQSQSYSADGNRPFPSNAGLSQVDLGRLDLNSEGFAPPGGFPGYIPGTPARGGPYGYGIGPSSGYGPPPAPVFGGPSAPGFVPGYGAYGVAGGNLGPAPGSVAVGAKFGRDVGGVSEGGGGGRGLGPVSGGRRRRGRGGAGVAAPGGSGGPRGGRGRGAALGGGPGRGRGSARGGAAASGAAAGRVLGLSDDDDDDDDEADDEDNGDQHNAEDDDAAPNWTEADCPRSSWNDEKTEILLDIIIEAKNRGVYSNGSMKARGYNYVLGQYYQRTGVKQHKTQIRNRLGQLKSMYSICQRLHNQTGRGVRSNGWPKASAKWWKQNLQGKGLEEFKNLRFRGPPYYEKLKDVFQGVAVDGSSAYHSGDVSGEEEVHDEDKDGGDDEDEEDWAEPTPTLRSNSSPASSGSRKRGSSTGTTGASPAKKTSRSPILRVMKTMAYDSKEVQHARLNFMREQNAEHRAWMREQAELAAQIERQKLQMMAELEMTWEERKAKKQAEEMAVLANMKAIAKADGWDTGGIEYMTLPILWRDVGAREFWLDSETPESQG
ncbi:hypothetical protein EJB05_04675, partial [Eragrostis curvula]